MPNQWAHSAITVSLGTKALNPSTPNQRAGSSNNVSLGTQALNRWTPTKPTGTISYQCQHGHKHAIDKRQTNGSDQLSMSLGTQALNRSMPNQ